MVEVEVDFQVEMNTCIRNAWRMGEFKIDENRWQTQKRVEVEVEMDMEVEVEVDLDVKW